MKRRKKLHIENYITEGKYHRAYRKLKRAKRRGKLGEFGKKHLQAMEKAIEKTGTTLKELEENHATSRKIGEKIKKGLKISKVEETEEEYTQRLTQVESQKNAIIQGKIEKKEKEE